MRDTSKLQKLLIIKYNPPPYHGVVKMMEIAADSDVLALNFKITQFNILTAKSAEKRGSLSFINIFYNLLNLLRYIIKLILVKPDIVYMSLAQNTFGFLRDSFFILTAKLLRAKICAHFHAGDFDKNYETKGKYYKDYISFIFTKVDRLIVLAEKFKSQFYNLLDKGKIFVLYNCLPSKSIGIISEEQKDKNIFRILFIGYLSKAKGALDIVKSIPIIRSKYKGRFEFVLCGSPVDIERNVTYIQYPHFGYTKMCEFIKNNNLQDYVKLLGYVNSSMKDELFKTSDIFILPSYSEGCGIAALEAMEYGLPLVITNRSALEEMLCEGENAFFIEPGDYKALADRLL
ncbi:glycosyltransferase family 4 protein, partial [bacterium]